jgi:hypothetical protein
MRWRRMRKTKKRRSDTKEKEFLFVFIVHIGYFCMIPP